MWITVWCVVEWFGPQACNLVILCSSPPTLLLDLFLVAPNSTPLLHFVYSQVACLLPAYYTIFMFILYFNIFKSVRLV